MKNPWMSLWLSAANKAAGTAAGTARGLWMAEAQRQQRAVARELAKAWSLTPPARKRPPAKRGK